MSESEEERLRSTERFYDRVAAVYDVLADSAEHDARERALALLAPRTGDRVLEIGFGTGHGLEALARAVGRGRRVIGIDISARMGEEAARRLDEAGLRDRVELLVQAVPPIPAETGSFDAAFASFAIELFPAGVRLLLLDELHRVLGPDGRLAVACMSATPASERVSMMMRAYRWMHRHFPHIADCEAIDLDDTMRRGRFRIERREALAIWGLPLVAAVARPV